MSDDDECDDIVVHLDSSPAISYPDDNIPLGTDLIVHMEHTRRVAFGRLIVPHEGKNVEPEELAVLNESRLYSATVEERQGTRVLLDEITAENAVQWREEEPLDDDEIKDSIHLAKQQGRRTRPPRKNRSTHQCPMLGHFEANDNAEMGQGSETHISKGVQNDNLESDKMLTPNEKEHNLSPVTIGNNIIHSIRLENVKREHTHETLQIHKTLRHLETQDSVEMELLTHAHTKDFHPNHSHY